MQCVMSQGHIQTDAPNTIHNYDEIIRPTSKKKVQQGKLELSKFNMELE